MKFTEEQRKKIDEHIDYLVSNPSKYYNRRSRYCVKIEDDDKGDYINFPAYWIGEYCTFFESFYKIKRTSIDSLHNGGVTRRKKNKNELRAEEVFKQFNLKFIPEYPILISNRDLWRSICDQLEVTDLDILNLRTMVLDFYSPTGGFGIEIDSKKFHTSETQRQRDLAKELYLQKMFKMDVVRVYPLLDFPKNSGVSKSNESMKYLLREIIKRYDNIDKGLEVGRLINEDIIDFQCFIVK